MSVLTITLSFLKRLPWQVYAAIAALGLLWWVYDTGYDNARAKGRAELAQTVAAYEAAQAEATRMALAAKQATEARYRNLAERIDREHASIQAAADTATDRYIADNRLRTCPAGGASGGTLAAANDHGAGISAPVPADPVVAVTDADVRACTAAVTYAISAREWALGLGG